MSVDTTATVITDLTMWVMGGLMGLILVLLSSFGLYILNSIKNDIHALKESIAGIASRYDGEMKELRCEIELVKKHYRSIESCKEIKSSE